MIYLILETILLVATIITIILLSILLGIAEHKIDKAIEYINTHKVSDTITFPLMKREQENQVKSCFDYEFKQVYKKELLNILQKGSEVK